MSKSQMIIEKVIMIAALYYIFMGIIEKDYFTLSVAVIIYIFELFVMNLDSKNSNKKKQ